jgi:hypothetical protein
MVVINIFHCYSHSIALESDIDGFCPKFPFNKSK